ncbi:MAG TPA: nuclear transport factor 2 family protein [Thermoanaerobaculia bacterium]|nr:nuclear transport factor 2 family protein [Thermoanaerobaculia bacterium]
MRRHLAALCVAVLGLASARVYAQDAAAGDEATVQELKKLEADWMRAVKAHDIATLEKLFAPEFTFVVAVAGKPFSPIDRDGYIARTKGYTIHDQRFGEYLVRVYGDVAVVVFLYTHKATLHGHDRSAEFFLTDTWRKRDGAWQAVARTSSRPEHPPASPPK